MRLDRLINEIDVFSRPTDVRRLDITAIADDTRNVVPGTLFCCVSGATVDGHNFAQEAIDKGAVALVVERELDVDVPQVRVPNVRAAIAPIAATFYGRPDRYLRIAGVTGTNGKTTTVNLLTDILSHKWKAATIGTLTGAFTTPPAIALQAMFDNFRGEGINAIAMEVSSHALTQHRVDATHFTVGVFTNLPQDHLDYHKTMNHYFEAKSLLFDPGRCEKAVINVDDEWGRKLVERIAVPAIPFSLEDAKDLEMSVKGGTFTWNGHRISVPLLGKFNVYNALAAATAAKAMGMSDADIAKALSSVSPVPGRIEPINEGQPFTVVVDFAHTPDGLQNVLETARQLAKDSSGRVLVVFGVAGDRDAGKRPQMGEIAERMADVVVVTTDNARTEDPAAIVREVVGGMSNPDSAHVQLDRARAIARVVNIAQPGDVVVIAGKGHETTQDIGGIKSPFDDRIVARQALQAMQKDQPGA